MSENEGAVGEAQADSGDRPLRFGTIVVVGGGCYGSYYVRQLRRAANASAVRWNRVVVVDRDANCAVASDTKGNGGTDGVELVVSEWRASLP